jgi:hypothetical protein
MTRRPPKDETRVSLAAISPAEEVADASLLESGLCAAETRRREQAFRRKRVLAARRRLAAGRYESDDLPDAVLDMVVEDLTSQWPKRRYSRQYTGCRGGFTFVEFRHDSPHLKAVGP